MSTTWIVFGVLKSRFSYAQQPELNDLPIVRIDSIALQFSSLHNTPTIVHRRDRGSKVQNLQNWISPVFQSLIPSLLQGWLSKHTFLGDWWFDDATHSKTSGTPSKISVNRLPIWKYSCQTMWDQEINLRLYLINQLAVCALKCTVHKFRTTIRKHFLIVVGVSFIGVLFYSRSNWKYSWTRLLYWTEDSIHVSVRCSCFSLTLFVWGIPQKNFVVIPAIDRIFGFDNLFSTQIKNWSHQEFQTYYTISIQSKFLPFFNDGMNQQNFVVACAFFYRRWSEWITKDL